MGVMRKMGPGNGPSKNHKQRVQFEPIHRNIVSYEGSLVVVMCKSHVVLLFYLNYF